MGFWNAIWLDFLLTELSTIFIPAIAGSLRSPYFSKLIFASKIELWKAALYRSPVHIDIEYFVVIQKITSKGASRVLNPCNVCGEIRQLMSAEKSASLCLRRNPPVNVCGEIRQCLEPKLRQMALDIKSV
jgi:hypothetical protein